MERKRDPLGRVGRNKYLCAYSLAKKVCVCAKVEQGRDEKGIDYGTMDPYLLHLSAVAPFLALALSLSKQAQARLEPLLGRVPAVSVSFRGLSFNFLAM